MDAFMFLLRVSPAESEPFEHVIEGDSLDIGRSTRCEITVADRFLSRRHARLTSLEDRWRIEDLGSRNGTMINGTRLDGPTEIKDGDVISLSASVIEVRQPATRRVPSDIATDVPSSDRLLKSAAEVLRHTETPPPAADAGETDLRKYTARLSLLNHIHQAMSRTVALDELLELILDHIFNELTPGRAEVFMRCSDGGYTCVANRSTPSSDLRSLYSESLFAEVVNKAMAALVIDAPTDHRFENADSLVSTGVHSLLAAPLFAADHVLGLIVLGSDSSGRRFTEEDLDLLVTLSSAAALRIDNLALTQEAAERRRLEHEVSIARGIQVALIPERLPEIAGYNLYGSTKPSRGVSGDYYQLVERAGGDEVVVALADVSGKGISAAMLTGYLEAVSSVPIEDGLLPHEIFNRISPKLHRRTPPNRFATMFLGVLAPRDASFRFASAGHSPACLVRASGKVDWLDSTGMPLGLIETAIYNPGETTLGPDDTLVIYSDGYTEAEGPSGQEFGQDRLAEVVVSNSNLDLDGLVAAIDSNLESYVAGQPFVDDRTIVVIRRIG